MDDQKVKVCCISSLTKRTNIFLEWFLEDFLDHTLAVPISTNDCKIHHSGFVDVRISLKHGHYTDVNW